MPEVVNAAPDVDKMSLAELESFVKGEPAAAPAPAAAQPNVQPARLPDDVPAPGQTKWIEIKDDEGQVNLRFRSEEEVAKSLIHSQKLIKQQKESLDRMNAERGELGQYKSAYEESLGKIDELSNYVAELQESANRMSVGQSPTATGANALAALTVQGGANNPQNLLLQEVQRIGQQLLEEKATNEQIRGEMAQFAQGLQQREQEVVVDSGVRVLYNEVETFSKAHPEYQTSQPFSKLDDIVSNYGEEAARAMISPEDFEKYAALTDLVGLYKNDPQSGEFDLQRKNYQDLDEAFVLQQYRTGRLGQTIADAHMAGVQNYEQALNRSAQSATVLPNNLVSRTQNVTMGPSEIENILNMDPVVVRSDPELSKKFDEAIKALGINTVAMGFDNP